MPSQPRNISEQEHSIRARSHELFVEEAAPDLTGRATRPFSAYLRETPARPLSALITAMLWIMGVIVGLLFLMAIWRVAHRHVEPARRRAEAVGTAMTRDVGPDRVPGSWGV